MGRTGRICSTQSVTRASIDSGYASGRASPRACSPYTGRSGPRYRSSPVWHQLRPPPGGRQNNGGRPPAARSGSRTSKASSETPRRSRSIRRLTGGARTHPGPRGPGSSCRGYGSPAGSRPVSHRPVRRSRRRSRYRPRRGCRRTGRTGSPPRACAPGARRGLSRGPVTLGPVTPGPGCLVRGAWFGQGAPVQLAAGRRREGVQHDHGGRDHVARQWRGEVAAQVGRARFGTAGRDHVRHQPPLPRPVFTDRDRRLGDYLVPGQLRLDLTGFDPEATDLDSLIGPPGELQNLLGGPPHQVPGSGTSAPPARRTGRPRTAWRSGRAG